ncbi:hypothetical protein SPRG_02111 [Saprolegnia parasitica CBS 223.65]|uniref:Tetratricopeptide repeat protein 21B n=1 Tax=Saprolegnia parasitica (strain CBS 223.65) TaxID=695850 RepID=A0A067D2Q1_SAPPC|nr:hypothetical protein SPRG_02111 [Saprolegnia parasitica CBS 223.65]KDO33302.1 hypothetical protein SPRG_02111 [Saprolegnia parasitica CBS 223.65]|eukprot:XP_012196052.1 hypothetical protein SPRG_02111 [Saprolegnia parasitica CBS 223.65]
MSSGDPRVLINYYVRKGWYDHVQRLCESILDKKGSDPTILFWRSFGIIMEGSYSSAIRELEGLKSKKEVELPCVHALIYTHNKCKHVDHDEIAQLELQVVIAEENATDASQLLCANFFWHTKETAKARKVLENLMGGRISPETPLQIRAAILRGWVDLTTEPKTKRDIEYRENSIQLFEEAKQLLGVAKYHDFKKNHAKALECYDEIIVKYTWLKHALSEKALVLFKMGEWDQCVDSAERALTTSANDIEALRLFIFYLLTREGKPKEAAARIRELVKALHATEASNPALYYDISKCIARIADKNHEVLSCNLALVEQAIKLSPETGVYHAERGYQRALMGDFHEAVDSYKDALKLDESNEAALHGLIYCQIKMGLIDDAAQQMEFLSVIQESMGASADFVMLQAMLSWHKDKDRQKQVKFLQKAAQLHMDKLKEAMQTGDLSTYDIMAALNPHFLVEIAMEFIKLDGVDDGKAMAARGISILDKIVAKSPGFLEIQFVLANAKFAANEFDDAFRICRSLLKMHPSHAGAHLLEARVSLEREHFKAAASSLDIALSHDFSVRQTPSFHIIKAKLLENEGNLKDALGCTRKKQVTAAAAEMSLFDKSCIYIQLASVHAQLNNVGEATRLVKEALDVFKGTTQEVRVLVANSELAIKRGDFDNAIIMLNGIPQESPAFIKAQMIKADIYLQHRKEKRLYAQCYKELVKLSPSVESHIRMAEAYLRIQQLDDAIESYRSALVLTPTDASLASRIGHILVKKHDYMTAIEYYESALKSAPDQTPLRTDLANLHARLHQYDQALRLIQSAPSKGAHGDVKEMLEMIELQLILPRIHNGLGNTPAEIDSLLLVANLQKNVLDKLRDERPDELPRHTTALATTNYKLAVVYNTMKDWDNVLKYCTMALRADESHEESILCLARIYNQMQNTEQCQAKCTTLLRLNPSHEEAAMMLADIMLQKDDNESAIFHFQNLLEAKADNFAVLSRFITMLRHAGKLERVPRFLKLAERSGPRVAHSAGLHFCKGLYNRYQNNIHDAVAAFNLARKDPEWGSHALINMIEIYLNPDNENIWDTPDVDSSKEQTENIRIANALLDELPYEKTLKLRVLEAYAVLANKTKPTIEKAIAVFLEILEQEKESVAALLGLATAYMLAKQQPKARNQLKRIAKMNYDPTLADEFERSYILLADIYVSRSKYDLAQELCKKALLHNKSSGKAWELLGLIMEKEQSYQDAADCYGEAWKCGGEASAPIGFKLAFNYLKAKRYVEAIDVSQKVLDKFPDYPKIRKEIREKAQAGLRP